MAKLNEYLTGVAMVTGNARIGPVCLLDLPPLLWGFGADMDPRGAWDPSFHGAVGHFTTILHDNAPVEAPTLSRDHADLAMRLSGNRGTAFLISEEWLVSARRSLAREQYAHAVIEATTAVEMLVADVIRTVCPLAGYDATKVQAAATAPFASRIKDHVAAMLGYDLAPSTSSDALGRWWQCCYALRNDAVHGGLVPSLSQSLAAVTSAADLLDEVLHRIDADARLRPALATAGWVSATHAPNVS